MNKARLRNTRQVGLFCGTFNPIHIGHLLIAECARDQFHLDKVVFVTSPSPPHRSDQLLNGKCRHELVEAAISTNKNFEASSIELERSGPSYTVDTAEAMSTILGADTRLNLIIGGDNLSQLTTWHRISDLLALCRILVVPRLRYQQEVTDGLRMVGERSSEEGVEELIQRYPHADIQEVDFPGIAISGSRIRERIREGKTVLYMVPPKVNDLLKEKGYYRSIAEKDAQVEATPAASRNSEIAKPEEGERVG